ncbi:Hexamerin [Dufourea novaeangliae]|uniref:Hexamerin n=1 Tax=Dufourea novaeangliae TaxID=178035 RepID=A0A154P5L8_DUFNO|nr:Hexamerin [Dufourea novaeangliae]
MLKIALFLAIGAVCLVEGARITQNRTADMDFLHNQKKIFELLLYVQQNDLIDSEYLVGKVYDLENNIDMYNDKTSVQRLLWLYRQGVMVDRQAIFSPYNNEQLFEMKQLFGVLISAKNFDTFYKAASWARLRVNPGIFVSAFSAAVLYRPDCKYMRLPAIYEIFPNLFYSSRVIQEAENIKMSRGMRLAPEVGNQETFMIYANYSSAYIPFEDSEYQLDYYMEDVSLNAYYYYFRQVFPTWLSSKTVDIPMNMRGQLYYFIHQQLMAKYYLERLSNNVGEIADFDWYKPIYPGFFSGLTYSNGIPIPHRNRYSNIPFYKNKYLKEVNVLETRIMEAIDSGYLYDTEGNKVNIYTPEGLTLLSNVIEGNIDSCNIKFYGMYDALARDILGYSFEYKDKSKMIPSALQCYPVNMRDPAFYMLYKRIMSYFLRYKKYLPSYTQSELQFPGVKIESVNIDKLSTYFDQCDTLISNAVAVENLKTGQSLRLKARRRCLNYKPFSYKFNINSDKEMKGMLRIFLGPSFDEIKQDFIYLKNYYYNFVEMDKFVVELRQGMNNIERQSSDSTMTQPEMIPSDIFMDKLNKAISGSEPFMYSESMLGFSERLTLPKGRPEGMKYKMFFFLSPFDEGSAQTYEMPMFGKILTDNRPAGFPLDRPMYAWNYTIPNMYLKDVLIYNLNEKEM